MSKLERARELSIKRGSRSEWNEREIEKLGEEGLSRKRQTDVRGREREVGPEM